MKENGDENGDDNYLSSLLSKADGEEEAEARSSGGSSSPDRTETPNLIRKTLLNRLMQCDATGAPSADSTIYSLDLSTREFLKLTYGKQDGDEKSADHDDDDDEQYRSRTFTISRLTYNLSEFDAIYRQSQDEDNDSCSKKGSKKSRTHKSSSSILLSALCRYIPILTWLRVYNWRKEGKSDFFAGITIAVFQIPQCMGYSLLAHVPPIYGLYSSFIPPLLYAIFGTSKHISVGTFAIISLMTGSIIMDLSNSQHYVAGQSEIEIATIIAFLIGLYQILFALGRFGFLAQFMSEQLVSGFITASAFYVFSSQLGYITGMHTLKSSGTGAFSLIFFYYNFALKVKDELHLVTFAISMVCIVILGFWKWFLLELFRRSKRKTIRGLVNLPFELILVCACILISWSIELHDKYHVKILGSVPVGLPNFTNIDYPMIWRENLWRSCIPLAIIAFAITYSTGVTFGTKHGYEVNANQELLAIGLVNTFCAYFRCIPTAASLSRSALQESIGARSQLAGVVSSICILIVLLFLSPMLQYLPICVLASIICVALKGLFMKATDFKKYYNLDKLDGSIWIVSFLSVLILNVDIGLYVGLAYSLLTLICKSQRPKTYSLGVVEEANVYVPLIHYPKAKEVENIKIYQFCGPLHFANVDYFKQKLSEKTKIKIKRRRKSHLVVPCAIIIDCSMFSYIDATGISTLRNLVTQYEMVGIRVLLAGVATHVAKSMAADGRFHQEVPTSKIYITVHDAVHMALEDMKNAEADGSPNLKDYRKSVTPENPYTTIEVEGHQEVTPKVKKKIGTIDVSNCLDNNNLAKKWPNGEKEGQLLLDMENNQN